MKISDTRNFDLAMRIASFLLLVTCAPIAFAEDDGDDPAVTVEKQIQTFTVNPDGSYEQVEENQKLIGQERGIKSAAQQYFHYNATLETIEILEAYTRKPDGRKIVVAQDQIKTQQQPRSFAAPMFQDVQYKVVVFPDVAIGDRVYVKLKYVQRTPLFPGAFTYFAMPTLLSRYKERRLIYDVPASMKLYADNVGFREAPPVEKGGRRIYEWVYIPKKKGRIEAGSVAYVDYGDRIVLSTFTDYGAFAKAYDTGATDKATVSPKVYELAQQLVKDVSDPKARAKALYNWVRKNIRYVAVFVGPGGVVPHTAETILDNRYGDCKDHVTLLEALLTSAGIESTPGLINLGDAYQLPTVPSLGVLNHVITYIPSLDLYLDSTAPNVEFGYLPVADWGKPVLLTKTGKLAHTSPSQLIRGDHQLRIKVAPDGAATFAFNERNQGAQAELSRVTVRNLKPSDRDQVVRRWLQQLRLEGVGALDPGNVVDTEGPYQLSASGKIDNLVLFPGPAALPAVTTVAGGISTTVANLSKEAKRTQPFACVSVELEETSEFDLPGNTSIVSLPRGISVTSKFFDFQSEYRQDGSKVSVTRVYRSHFPSIICQPEDFNDMKPTLGQIMNDLRSQIIVRRDSEAALNVNKE